ncbi:phenylalanyl-tRNA synthetase, alpha subunit [Ruminiclostridium papyrosolvens DSM 2782]|uniref:Phenylalanine--tRNA ligase alpha subunit n=1 Tax=Ruminiclostridium papyrosolvens DSM 2782 TaxID=588581 RepID=F1T9M5_9FIRM|nr:phenylalanine--tRNA ligase subunit alpha [Ruminiclostridium papyrosolvens]EGD49207.1 phenylalanyl-tRNA synthetase, alpha subunit [Ruminiclostridium papyrosolvens DSM 2782]WES35685.1 phenylalanine--tRNA ligase subunit alpha [Ruminiclostridium papyrosolvens DSM 2782]
MIDKISNLRDAAIGRIKEAVNSAEVEELRVKLLGKKGELTEMLKDLKNMDIEERKQFGQKANALKTELTEIIEGKFKELSVKDVKKSLSSGSNFDISLPGTNFKLGSLHPVTIVQKEIERIFTGMGFNIVDGPEAEEEFFNFEALNIPKHHPARDMQDTYWLENGSLLRTHTSPCQVRAMQKYGAPLKVIAPGRCFRNESTDASHENTFFQLEGMMIDKNVSIANLIYVMKLLLSEVFQRDVKIRLRPGFFPFVEPGFELDLNCMICGGKGCPTCKHSGWIELLPCGMVHPNVLRYGGIDTEEYTGFAFGLGLTRLAMMKYGISDIRVLNSGDLRAMEQFSVR